MNELLVFLKAAACAGIFWRLYTYRWDGDARYRLSITVIAYVLMFCAGGQALTIFMGLDRVTTPYEVTILWCLNVLVWASRGNLARVISISDANHVPRWSGFDRRRHK